MDAPRRSGSNKPRTKKPRVFIGSSTEGMRYAEAVFSELERISEPKMWDVSFQPTHGTLEDLERAATQYDFAVFVMSPDDVRRSRGKQNDVPRDNVLLEFGLFVGSIGRDRVFFLRPRGRQLQLPSDLLGVTPLEYTEREDADYRSSVRTACGKVRELVNQRGLRNQPMSFDLHPALVNALTTERIRRFHPSRNYYASGRDHRESLDSYVLQATHTLTMVSVTLVSGMRIDEIIPAFKSLLGKKPPVKILVSLLNYERSELMRSLAPVLDLEPSKLKAEIKSSVTHLSNSFASEGKRGRFQLWLHSAIPPASAILIDEEQPHGLIQLETKPYRAGLGKSFGFEVSAGSDFYSTLKKSYRLLQRHGRRIL